MRTGAQNNSSSRDLALASGLRQIIRGLTTIADALDSDGPDGDASRKAETLRRFDVRPADGLSQAAASLACRENMISPKAVGAWISQGLVTREGDRRWLTDKGREWLAVHSG
jgi:hypothetical protein